MLSFREIQELFPKTWVLEPNIHNNVMNEIFQEFVNLGIWKEECPRHLVIHENISSFSKYYYPTVNSMDLFLATEFVNLSFLFDDLIESSTVESAKYHTNRFINIFTFQKLEEDYTNLENLALHIIRKLKKRCGERIDIFNLLITSIIDFMNSLIPVSNIKSLNIEPAMDLYYFLRRNDIGLYPIINLALLFSVSHLDCKLFLDPRWCKMIDSICNIYSIFNDMFSYEKEIKDNDCKMNSFYFNQIKHKLSKEECFQYLFNEIKNNRNQLFRLEDELYKQYYPTLNENNQMEFNQVFNHIHSILMAILIWPLQSPRYQSKDSIFLELRSK